MSENNKIRKPLYITPEQERLLKERREALRRVLETYEEIASKHRFPDGYKFDREEVYKERMKRLLRGRGSE